MKKIVFSALILFCVMVSTSCSKDECVCVTTTTENGVVTSTSSNSNSTNSGVPGPLGNAYDEDCDSGDYSSVNNTGNTSYSTVTECELE